MENTPDLHYHHTKDTKTAQNKTIEKLTEIRGQ